MAFICPECNAQSALGITRTLELPSDSRSDEISLQLVRCSACGFEGIAVYQESRRGPLGDEAFDHAGYHVDPTALSSLRTAMAGCPEPRNAACRCAAHRRLGRRDPNWGRWAGMEDVPLGERFAMRRAPRQRVPTLSSPPPPARPSHLDAPEGAQIDRFMARLRPPAFVAMLTLVGLALAGALILLPELAAHLQLDSLAFGIALCWIPIGAVGLLAGALRTRDSARRAWGWLGVAVLVGVGVTLFMDMLLMRGEAPGPRSLLFLLCAPLMLPPLLPALYYMRKVWHEVAQNA